MTIIILSLHISKQAQKVNSLTQGHIAGKWLSRDSNLSLHDPIPVFGTHAVQHWYNRDSESMKHQ